MRLIISWKARNIGIKLLLLLLLLLLRGRAWSQKTYGAHTSLPVSPSFLGFYTEASLFPSKQVFHNGNKVQQVQA